LVEQRLGGGNGISSAAPTADWLIAWAAAATRSSSVRRPPCLPALTAGASIQSKANTDLGASPWLAVAVAMPVRLTLPGAVEVVDAAEG
jgi:hypothetical protein